MRRRRRTTTTIVIITIYIYISIHPSIPKPPQRHHRKWCAAEIGSRADRALARPSASHGTQIIVKYNDIDSVSQDYSMPMSLSIYIYTFKYLHIYIHPILLSTNYNEKLSDIAGCFVQHISRKIGKLMDFLFWGRNLIKSLNLYGWYQSPPIGLVEPPATFFEPWLSMNI